MNARQLLRIVWGVVRIALPLTVGLAIIVGIVCWLIGWRDWDQVANALQYTAVAAFILGGIGLMSTSGLGKEMIGPATSSDSLPYFRWKQQHMDRETLYFFVGALTAALLFLFSLWIRSLAGSA